MSLVESDFRGSKQRSAIGRYAQTYGKDRIRQKPFGDPFFLKSNPPERRRAPRSNLASPGGYLEVRGASCIVKDVTESNELLSALRMAGPFAGRTWEILFGSFWNDTMVSIGNLVSQQASSLGMCVFIYLHMYVYIYTCMHS